MKHLVTSEEFPHLGGNILEGDDATWEPVLWEWLVRTCKIKTVLDVGCGCGFSTRWFREQGCMAVGLDGLPSNVAACGSPAILCDLSKPIPPLPLFDLVWCCEVVEHVREEHLDGLLEVLSRGRIVAMTFAGPGQGGHHHVNEKPEDYWIRKLESVDGVRFLSMNTGAGRAKCDPSHHFAQRGLIFKGKES